MKLPLSEKFTGKLEEWEEWSWQVKSYISLFHPEVTEVMDSAEIAAATVTDEKLTVIEQSEEAITGLVAISRQLHYLLSQITTDSAPLIVRGKAGLNGFETVDSMFRFTWDCSEHQSVDQSIGIPTQD